MTEFAGKVLDGIRGDRYASRMPKTKKALTTGQRLSRWRDYAALRIVDAAAVFGCGERAYRYWEADSSTPKGRHAEPVAKLLQRFEERHSL